MSLLEGLWTVDTRSPGGFARRVGRKTCRDCVENMLFAVSRSFPNRNENAHGLSTAPSFAPFLPKNAWYRFRVKVLRRPGGGAGRRGTGALGHPKLQQELPHSSRAGASRGGGRDHPLELSPLHGGQQGRRRPRRRLRRCPVRIVDTSPVLLLLLLYVGEVPVKEAFRGSTV